MENKKLSWKNVEVFCKEHLYTIIVVAGIGSHVFGNVVYAKAQKAVVDEAKKITTQSLMIQAIKE